MTTVHLERYETGPSGTWGRLWVEGPDVADSLCLHTLEPPWRDNQPRVSCIPAGQYPLVLGRYQRGGYPTYEVEGVPGRDAIKLHAANWARELEGCIAPGTDRGILRGVPSVLRSRLALQRLMAALEGVDSATIYITWRTPDIAPSDR